MGLSLVAASRRVQHGGEPTNKDVERHREALGRMAEIGATWVSFAWDFSTQSETLDFIDAFAETYLGEQRIRTAAAAPIRVTPVPARSVGSEQWDDVVDLPVLTDDGQLLAHE